MDPSRQREEPASGRHYRGGKRNEEPASGRHYPGWRAE